VELLFDSLRTLARDLLFLGKAAFNKGLYDRSIMWLEMALSRAENEAQNEVLLHPTATREEILPFLETTRRVVCKMKQPNCACCFFNLC